MRADETGQPAGGNDVSLASLEQHPEFLHEFIALDEQWPRFMLQDPYGLQLGRIGLHVAAHSFVVLEAGEVVGRAVSVPVSWGVEDPLPERGWDAAIESAVEVLLSNSPPRCLCALEITLSRAARGGGLGAAVLRLLRVEAARGSFEGLVAPVRPTGKASHPKSSMAEYLATQRVAGMGDPWLEAHESMGAEVHAIAELSMTIPATFDTWRAWTGIDPATIDGPEMFVPGALAPVMLDHANRIGTYVEPNIWCKHRLVSERSRADGDATDFRSRGQVETGAVSGDGAVIDLRDFDSVVVPPEIPEGWSVTAASGSLLVDAEELEYETFLRAQYCKHSDSGRVEEYEQWRDRSEFVVVLDPDGTVQGAVRILFGPYDELPVGAFERNEAYPTDPVLEYASLSVRPECRKTGVTEWLYRAVWQQATLRGAAGMVAIGETWLMALLNDTYEFGFRQLGPERQYMGGDCFVMGTDVGSLMQRMLRQPSLFEWGSGEIDLRDIPRAEVRSAVEELRRS